MKRRTIKKNNLLAGFTLIEMMFVIVIIGILASLMTTGAFRAIREAREEKARVTISALETALEMYKLNVGSYPLGDGSGNSFWYYLQDDRSGDTTGWDGPYMSFSAGDISGSGINDPWGTIYKYGPGTDHSGTKNPFDIWVNGKMDEINSWD